MDFLISTVIKKYNRKRKKKRNGTLRQEQSNKRTQVTKEKKSD
jgi:hypothetical protein